MKFSDNLRNLRISRGLTQMQLAEGLGTSQSSITSWEMERREPDFSTIQRIADYFKVPLSALLPSSDNHLDVDYLNAFAEMLNQNAKLRDLFDLIKTFNDQNLDTMIAVARSIAGKNT